MDTQKILEQLAQRRAEVADWKDQMEVAQLERRTKDAKRAQQELLISESIVYGMELVLGHMGIAID